MRSTLVYTYLFSALVAASPVAYSQKRAAAVIGGYAYEGCYTEATAMRAFSGKSYYDDAMTIEKCAAACSGFTWFGVEYHRECYCGDAPNTGSVKVPEAECSFECPGNAAQNCGAGNRLNTYAKTGTAPSTPEVPSTYGTLGCYTEATTGRALNSATFSLDTMTIELCASKCTGYSMFGLEYGRECYCGNTLQPGSVKASELECGYACKGDNTETCGGDWRLNLYEVGLTSIPQTPKSPYDRQGCYTETSGQRVLTGKSYFDDLMTVEKCATACTGYTWFGVEYGRECYCGLTMNSGSKVVDDSDCSFACPGDSSEKCGAGDRLDMYKFGSTSSPSTTSASSASSTSFSSSTTSSTMGQSTTISSTSLSGSSTTSLVPSSSALATTSSSTSSTLSSTSATTSSASTTAPASWTTTSASTTISTTSLTTTSTTISTTASTTTSTTTPTTTSAIPSPTPDSRCNNPNSAVLNPSFESAVGSFIPWVQTVFTNINFFTTAASSDSMCGTNTGIFRFLAKPTSVTRIQQTFSNLQTGTKYNLSAYFKRVDTTTVPCSIWIYMSDTTFKNAGTYTTTPVGGAAWTQLSGSWTALGPAALMQVLVTCNKAMDIYVDNISLTPA